VPERVPIAAGLVALTVKSPAKILFEDRLAVAVGVDRGSVSNGVFVLTITLALETGLLLSSTVRTVIVPWPTMRTLTVFTSLARQCASTTRPCHPSRSRWRPPRSRRPAPGRRHRTSHSQLDVAAVPPTSSTRTGPPTTRLSRLSTWPEDAAHRGQGDVEDERVALREQPAAWNDPARRVVVFCACW
jgi:hypothetical protein